VRSSPAAEAFDGMDVIADIADIADIDATSGHQQRYTAVNLGDMTVTKTATTAAGAPLSHPT